MEDHNHVFLIIVLFMHLYAFLLQVLIYSGGTLHISEAPINM